MRVHNKIGSKERFMQMFENVNKIKVKEKKLVIKENKKVINKWGIVVKPSRITESTDMDRYENVVFAQGEDADEPLNILNTQGEEAALQYLKQWHDYGNHEGTDQLGAGSSDQTYEKDGYIMSYNPSIGYIGLQYDLQQGEEMGESFDNPKEKDDAYLNKGNVTDVLKQTKVDGGYDYPVKGVALKVKDPSLQGLKGDRLPFAEDDQDVADVDSEKDDEFQQTDEPIPNDGEGEIGGEIEAELSDEPTPDDVGVEPEADDELGGGMLKVLGGATGDDELEGGKGDDAAASDFDPIQISKGIKVEMEHTEDPKMALEIVLDHLTEDPQYYGEGGVDPDAAAMTSAQDDSDKIEAGVHDSSYVGDEGEEGMGDMMQAMMGGEEEPEGDEESEILFGRMGTVGKDGTDEMPDDLDFNFKPHQVGEDFDFAGQETDYYDNKYMEDDNARKEELLAKGQNLTPEEEFELQELLGGGQEGDSQIASQNGFGNIKPSGSVSIGEDNGMYNGPNTPLQGDGVVNFDTQSAAVEKAVEDARARGFVVNDEDIANSPFAEGWVGYENDRRGSIPLYDKNNKPMRKMLQIQLYRKGNGLYELNHYIN